MLQECEAGASCCAGGDPCANDACGTGATHTCKVVAHNATACTKQCTCASGYSLTGTNCTGTYMNNN